MFDYKNIKPACIRIKKQVKDFLLSEKSREFFIFLFFFFVAAGVLLVSGVYTHFKPGVYVSPRPGHYRE